MADATDETTTEQVGEEDADRPLDEAELEGIQAAGKPRSERGHDSSHSNQVREQNAHERRQAMNNS